MTFGLSLVLNKLRITGKAVASELQTNRIGFASDVEVEDIEKQEV